MSHHPTILIIEDDAILRELLRTVLSSDGHHPRTAADGQQGLKLATELLPDLILLDVMLPGIDGFEVCRTLRADPVLAEVPIVMLTALTERASRLQGIEAGADDFITKPFDIHELRVRVRSILRLNRFRLLLDERQRVELLEEEQRRLAFDLHDNLAQMTGSLRHRLEAFAHGHRPRSAEARQELEDLVALAEAAARETRSLLENLQTDELDGVTLSSALRILAEAFSAQGLEVAYTDGLAGERLPAKVETALFGVAREALNNVHKHTETTHATLSLQRMRSTIRLEVRDQGRGFDLASVAARTHSGREGIGLRSMRQRMRFAAGTLEIHTAAGAGVMVVAEAPVPDNAVEPERDWL